MKMKILFLKQRAKYSRTRRESREKYDHVAFHLVAFENEILIHASDNLVKIERPATFLDRYKVACAIQIEVETSTVLKYCFRYITKVIKADLFVINFLIRSKIASVDPRTIKLCELCTYLIEKYGRQNAEINLL
jgi:hypothetical protein